MKNKLIKKQPVIFVDYNFFATMKCSPQTKESREKMMNGLRNSHGL